MCGLVGFIGKPDLACREAFENLLNVDIIRGPHSTGIAAIEKKRVDLLKDAVLPWQLLQSEQYKRLPHWKKFCWMGHNRFATVGKVNQANAHPFKVGRITGMHNGTVWEQWFPQNCQKDTDSETIMTSLDKRSVDDTWKDTNGAAALVWWDAQSKTLNFLKNDERPVFWAFLEKDEGMFWASEAWMLRGVLGRKKIKIKDDKIWAPDNNKLFTFKYDAGKGKISYVSREVQPYVPPVRGRKSADPFTFGHPTMVGTRSATSNVTWLPARHLPKQQVLLPLPGDRRKGVTKAEFVAYFGGCMFCKEPLDFDTMLVLDRYDCEAVCESCQVTAELNGMDVNHVGCH